MRSALILTMILAPVAAAAQTAAQAPAACERLSSTSLPNTTIALAQIVNAGAFAVPANPAGRGGGGSSALAGTLGPVPEVPGRVTANTAGPGPRIQRRTRHPGLQHASRLLPRRGDVEAVRGIRYSRRGLDADRGLERPVSRHQPQRPRRRHQLQRHGRRPDRRLPPSPARSTGIRAATPAGCKSPTRSRTSPAAPCTRPPSPEKP